jgi:DNA-binding SARP family transcriptional activator
MGFRILGPLAVIDKGREITPTAPKVRQVLTFLLVRRNQVVQVSEFVDELWSNHPPDSAMTTLQTYIYKLRKDVLDPSGLARLHTKPCGYLLDVADENIDVCRFDSLSGQGRAALENNDPAQATRLLSEALGLWNGQALVGVTAGEILSAHVTRLEENRLRALEMRIEADMALGRYQEIISELKVLVFRYPLHERFHGDLMLALNRSGRRFEALEVYRRLRAVLIDELGLEPSSSVQRLHQSLLSADSGDPAGDTHGSTGSKHGGVKISSGSGSNGAASIPAPRGTGGVYVGTLTVPAQLPPDTHDFTGRAAPLAQIHATLTTPNPNTTTSRIISITGMAGVGKTSLALHAAHIDRHHYPDGQLHADLKATTPTPTPPTDILATFLRAVGVPDHQIPPTLDERTKLFRTWSHDRRVLLILDDAHNTTQITPLLPANPQSAVIITSRWALPTLPGNHTTQLPVMTTPEALNLLSNIIGHQRVTTEHDQAEKIVTLCGHLPLALRCIGARLAAMTTWPLRKTTTLIENTTQRLDHLQYAEYDVRAGYDGTYNQLDPHDRSTFRLLGLLPPHDFNATTAAGLTGTPPDTVEAQLTRLVSAHLLHVTTTTNTEDTHYHLNELTRLYARERLDREFIQPESIGA